MPELSSLAIPPFSIALKGVNFEILVYEFILYLGDIPSKVSLKFEAPKTVPGLLKACVGDYELLRNGFNLTLELRSVMDQDSLLLI